MTIQTDHQRLSADLPVMSPTSRNNPKPTTLGFYFTITQRFQQLLGLHFIQFIARLVDHFGVRANVRRLCPVALREPFVLTC